MPTGPTTAPGRCWRAEIGSGSCQPFSTSLPELRAVLGGGLMVAELDGFEEVLEAGLLFDRFHREVGAVHQSLLGSLPQGVAL